MKKAATGVKRKAKAEPVSASEASEESSASQSLDDEPAAPPASTPGVLVHPKRVQSLKSGAVKKGPVIYWMSRDQRVADNYALLHAVEQAQKTGSPVAVVFNVVTAYLNAGARQFGFMLRGLKEMPAKLADKNIAFYLLQGNPVETIPKLVADTGASLLITDYAPLRLGRQWRTEVASKISVPFHEVDAHNVVPVWVASDKREIGARTLRPKIHKLLPEYLRPFPALPAAPVPWPTSFPSGAGVASAPAALAGEFDALLAEALTRGAAVPEVDWLKPGEAAAAEALAGFLSPARLSSYDTKRNDPCGNAQSGLSAYFHFGQLAPQRAALSAAVHRHKYKASVEGFLEELVVRRELSDNFCHHAPDTYDNLGCAAVWARESLDKHRVDKREFIYTREKLEFGRTHDELWNACELEMVHLGKMHGFMRMYWAKKILEWTNGPEEAMEIAIYLNDKYEIDGRDANGYTGIAWSMCGVHDMGWTERAIFGKIRFMNYAGCKRKFDIAKYCSGINKQISEVRKANTAAGRTTPGGAAPPTVATVLQGAAKAGVKRKAAE